MPDILAETQGRPAPALSATSDMPAFSAPEEADPPSPPKQPARSTTSDADSGKGKKPAPVVVAPPPSPVDDILRRAQEVVAKAEETLSRAKPIPPVDDPADPRPVRQNFDNPNAYDEALVGWSRRRAARGVEAEQQRQETARLEKQQRGELQQLQKTWSAKREAALQEFPDFAKVVERDDLQITDPMMRAIIASDSGPAIAYHLGENPTEAERIAKLSPVRQAVEIGKLEEKVTRTPPARRQAKASPTPPRAARAPAEPDMAAYAKQWHERQRASR